MFISANPADLSAHLHTILTRSGRRGSGGLAACLAPLLIALGLALGGCSQITDRDIRYIQASELRELQIRQQSNPSTLALVDPRSVERFEAGHIPGAVRLTLGQIQPDGPRRPELVGRQEIVVYGEDPTAGVGQAMTKRLMEAGYRNVRFYAGGVREYARLYGLQTIERPAEPQPEPQDTSGT